MRVLYLHEFGRMGGAELGLLRLIGAIRPMGVEPVVLWPRSDTIFERLSSKGNHVVRLKVPRWRHGLSMPLLPLFLVRLRLALPRGNVDVIHANNYRSAPFGQLVARWAGVPCVSTVREQVSPERVRTYRLQRSDALIAVSDAVAQNLVDGGVSKDRVTTVRSGVAIGGPARAKANENAVLRANLGIAPGAPLIGIVAHVLPHKGFDDLLRALALIVREVPHARCLIVGETPRRKYLAHLLELAERLAIRDRLVLVGPQEDVVRYFDVMDLFVLPSHTEGLPLTVLEAMAAGKPVVATAVGGIPEVVCNGETGLVVPPRDPTRLAEAAIAVLTTPSLARAMGQAGRTRIEGAFTIEREAEQTAKLYRRILTGKQVRVS